MLFSGFDTANSDAEDTIRRIQRIQAITIVWMSVEAAVSLSAAFVARSPALLAFGGDRVLSNSSQRRRCCGGFVLTPRKSTLRGVLPKSREYCFLSLLPMWSRPRSSTLLGHSEPKTTYLGDSHSDRSRRNNAVASQGEPTDSPQLQAVLP